MNRGKIITRKPHEFNYEKMFVSDVRCYATADQDIINSISIFWCTNVNAQKKIDESKVVLLNYYSWCVRFSHNV
jgi:hypothetical protein